MSNGWANAGASLHSAIRSHFPLNSIPVCSFINLLTLDSRYSEVAVVWISYLTWPTLRILISVKKGATKEYVPYPGNRYGVKDISTWSSTKYPLVHTCEEKYRIYSNIIPRTLHDHMNGCMFQRYLQIMMDLHMLLCVWSFQRGFPLVPWLH